MGILTDTIREAGRQAAAPSVDGAGVGQIGDREQAIIDRHKEDMPKGSLFQGIAQSLAEEEIGVRKQQRDYAEKAKSTDATTVDLTKEMLKNLNNRSMVLDTYRQMSPAQRQEVLNVTPGLAQELGDDRGGIPMRAFNAVTSGISDVAQPVMEFAGAGGTPEEIEFIRKLEGAASQEFAPARPGDPWYEKAPLQALQQTPWMATTIGGGIGGGAAAKAGGQLLARGASAGVPGAKAVFQGVGAVGKIPKIVGLKGATTKATMEGLGTVAGITAAGFPSQYAQEVDQLKELGMVDDTRLRLLAGATALVASSLESIIPNPLKAGPVSITDGAVKAARQYLWNAAKQAPGEMSEEYLQGVTSGLGQHIAQYVGSQTEMDFGDGEIVKFNPVERKSIADAFQTGYEQAKEAALPMAFLLGVPAVGGAGRVALKSRGFNPEAIAKNMASLDKPPGAHKWAEINLGDRSRFKDAPDEATRAKQWEQSRGAVQPEVPQNVSDMFDRLKGSSPENATAADKTVPVTPTGTQSAPQYKNWRDFGTGEPEGQVPPPLPLALLDKLRGKKQAPPATVVPPPLPETPPPLPKRKGPTDGQVQPNEQVAQVQGQGEQEAGSQGGQEAQGNAGTKVQVGTPESQADEPPVPEGMTRLYHGSATPGRVEGKAWFSTDRRYAENYRGKDSSELQYVDMPTEWANKQRDPDGYGQTPDKGFTLNVELDSSETGPRKTIAKPAVAPATEAVKPPVTPAPKQTEPAKPEWDVRQDSRDGKLYRYDPSAKSPSEMMKTRQPVDPSEGVVLATKDQWGKPIKEEILAAQKEFVAGAKPGATFDIKGFETSGPYRVMDDGQLLDTATGRAMGDVQGRALLVTPGMIRNPSWAKPTKEAPSPTASEGTTGSPTVSPDALGSTSETSKGKAAGEDQSSEARADTVVAYHGAATEFAEFDPKRMGERDPGYFGKGFYFTDKAGVAQQYGDVAAGKENAGKVITAELDTSKFIKTTPAQLRETYGNISGEELTKALQKDGYQGVSVKMQSGNVEHVAFDTASINIKRNGNGGIAPAASGPAQIGQSGISESNQSSEARADNTPKQSPRVYREMAADELDSIINPNTSSGETFGGTKRFWSDNPDLAIGQGTNKGFVVELDPSGLSLKEHAKPGTAVPGVGKEFTTSHRADEFRPGVRSVTIKPGATSPSATRVKKFLEGEVKAGKWSKSKAEGSGVVYSPVLAEEAGQREVPPIVEKAGEQDTGTKREQSGEQVGNKPDKKPEISPIGEKPEVGGAQPEQATDADFDAEMEKLMAGLAEPESGLTKPSAEKRPARKPRSVKKQPTKTQAEKAADDRASAAAKKEEAKRKMREAFEGTQGRPLSGFDPEIGIKVAQAAKLYIEAGALDFRAFIRELVADFGKAWVEDKAPYFESAWRTANKLKWVNSPAGKVADVLTEVRDEIDTGTTRDGGGTSGARTEDLAAVETEAGEVADAGRPANAGDGGGRGLAGDRGRAQNEGAESPAGTERGDEDVRRATGPGGNYRIGSDERVGSGSGRGFSAKARFAENVKAIRLLKALEKEGRKATAEEQSVLVKYIGWGGLKQAFGRGKLEGGKTVYQPIKGYEAEFTELKALLTDEEWNSAKKSITNAHYTDPAVIRGMWQGLKALGFKGGKIVEPSSGTGLFFGLIPQSILDNPSTRLAATEIDSVSGRIAQQLYQGADIRVHGFEELNLADNSVDLFISNVPFGRNQLSDKKDRSIQKAPIHNFFFNKAIRKTRPGGLVAFITSRFSMDEKDASTREFWDKSGADLVGVVRLPGGAFKGIANTDVVTDIIILQKREDGAKSNHAAPWKKRKNVPQTGYMELVRRADGLKGKIKVRNEGDTAFPVNEYFEAHPEHIVGELAWTGTMQKVDENQVNVEAPETGAIGDRVSEIISELPADKEGLDHVAEMTDGLDNADMEAIKSGEWKEDHLRVEGDRTYHNDFGTRVEVPTPFGRHKKNAAGDIVEIVPNKKGAERFTAIIKVFDAAERLIALQPTDATDAQIEAAREKLNKVYDAAVKKYGPLSSGWNATFARKSLSVASRVFSLEEYDPTNDTAKKAAIFTERTERPHTFATSADNAQDALTISLSQVGRLDPDHAANLLGKPVDATMEELGDLVFKNHSGEWELASTYLSGNVRLKLAEAKELAKDNEGYLRNVEALEAVQPADLSPSQIEVRLNSPWIPTDVFEQFLAHLLRREVKVSRSQAAGKWFLTPESRARNDQLETLDWGIARMPALDIITKSLNRGDLRVWDTDGHGGRVVNRDDTTTVAAKLTKIKAEFERWIWDNPERVDLLTGLYNREINNIHQEPRDGSHLTFPGMSEDVRAKLDAHQVNAVWRYLTGGNMLLAHIVGAGKSWVMAAAAMEQKRISGNPSYKTMIAVPNHLVTSGQFVKEILEAYPSAKILAATPDSLSGIGRRSLLKKIATGNYDIVAIAHSSFGKIPLNPTHESDFIQKQIDDLEAEVRTARADSDRSYEAELQTMIDNLRDKLADMSAALQRDELSTYFDELNIDSLFVDEAHEFKNLAFRTRMSRVPGVNPTGSNMAFDMWMKTTYFNKATNEKNLMFATGTPIANAIAEMYTMQRYLQPSELARLGLEHFDSWAASFADEVTKPEIDPAGGGMRMHSRLSQYINMPELSAIFRQIADVQTADMLVDVLKRPLIEGDAPQAVKAERNAILEEIIEGLQERAQRVRSGMVDKSEDNMLNIVTDGRKAATDIRLIDPSYPDLKGSKVNLAVENIHRIWEDTSDKKSTQIVWLDVTSPNTDYPFNLYHEIVDKLAALGIPRDEIAIMHDYNEKTKSQLFRSMNKGDVRILLGSTAVMGTGVNVQKRLIASHHLDVPWRPDQLEQRDGRILRRGNVNKKVHIVRYISKGSFDSFMWDKIEQKSSFIRAAMSGASDRVLDASEAEDMSAAEMKAAAADDPNLIRFVTVQAEVNKLESEHRGFLDQQSQIRQGIASAHRNVEFYAQRADNFESMIQSQESLVIPDGEVRAKIGDAKFTDPKEFGKALTDSLINAGKEDVHFEYNGFKGATHKIGEGWVDKSLRSVGWFGSQATHIDLELSDSPVGNVTRLNNAIAKLKEQPEYYRNQVEQNRLKIPALEKRIQAGWPDAGKLSDLRQEQATLAGLVQSSGSDEHKQEIASRIEQQTNRKVIISAETGRYLWEDVEVADDKSQNAAQNEAAAVIPPNIVDVAEGQLTAERNRDREERLQKLRLEAETYEWDRSVSPRPAKKKTTRKKASAPDGDGESRSLDEFTSPELQDRQSMGAARVRIASAADLVGDDVGGTDSQYASPDEEFERRWQMATRGISKKTLATKLREFWKELVKSTVRGSLPELPRTEQFGEARSAMHAYQNAPTYAQLATADLLKKTSKPLSAKDYDLFTRIVIMRDQAEAADKGERLSYGLTPGKAKAELDRVEALAESNERVQASLEYRKQWTEAMVDDFLSAHEYLGLDMSDRFKRENYFRHQVLYYMEAQQLGLGKKKVELTPNRGWLKGRTSGDDLGEAFDINANYLQAEWEVSTQMIADTKRAQAIGRLKRHYDKMRQLKDKAKQNNYVAVVGGQDVMDEIEDLRGKMDELRASGSLDSGEKAQMKAWSERVWELDPTMEFRQQMAIARDKIERGAAGLGEEVPDDFMRYVASLAKQEDSPLQTSALSFLKAVSDRKAFIENALGKNYETWEDVVPDDHEEVAIRPGRAMFQAYSVPEQIASELMADLSKTLGINADDLRPLTALGSKYTPLVVPQEVAAQMAAIDNTMDFGWLDRMVTKPMRAWKRLVLMGPTRFIKYNLRNLSEIDKVMSLNPAALKDIPQAIRDLWKLYSGADDIPATVRDWVERGGSGTLVRVNELGELNELKQFARLIADKKSGVVGKVIKAPVNAWRTYWSAVGMGSDFRESILRYAAYLNYVKQLEAGKLTNYGGSVRAEVDGIKDNKDKAMRLSADLLGDYGDISLVGQFLRDRTAPFWSFQETNVRTYFRGLINLASNEQSAIKAGMQVARAVGIGGLAKTPFLAYKLGRIAILFYGLKAMTTAFNQLLFSDDDDELSEEEKRKAHLTFGKNSKGEVQYFSRIGTAADVLDWVGLDSVDYDLRDVLDGRRTIRDVLNDMARSPVDKAYGMLSPFMKVPTELAVGQTAYPSVGKPRPIRDRGRYIAQNLGLQKEYDKLAGNPSTPYSVTDLFLYKVEPGTSAYYLTLDAKFRWLKTARNRGVGYSDSTRGNALRSYKMAMRLNDQVAVDKYLAEYEAAGGTKDGLLDSVEWSHPAGGLSTIDAYLFYKSLAPVEQQEYRDAERFYYSELLTEEQAKEIRARRDKRLKALAFGKNKDGSPKGKPEKKSDETQATYNERLRDWKDERATAKEALQEYEERNSN